MNKLMQDKELFQEFLNHHQNYYRVHGRVWFMFNRQFINVLGDEMWHPESECLLLDERLKIDYDAEYKKIIDLLASFTKEDIKKYTNALTYIIEYAVSRRLPKLLDIILTYIDLKTLKRNFVIADAVQSCLIFRNEEDESRLKSLVEILKVFLNHKIDIVEFFRDGFIFNNEFPEIHQELIKAGYDYSEYMSTEYLDTEVDTNMKIRCHCGFRAFTLKKEHKQVIKDAFLAHKHILQ